MKLLVSMCNKDRAKQARLPGVHLFEVETDSGAVRPIALRHPDLLPAKGITGLAHFDGGILAVMQGKGQLALIDTDGQVHRVWNVPDLKHGHSIAVAGKKAYINSTGRDSILEFDPARGTRIYWKSNGGRDDTLHVNSVVLHEGELYATAFGPKAGPLWASATAGRLFRLTTEEMLAAPLHHPHSACRAGNRFYFCESSKKTIGRDDGQRLPISAGYPRGLAMVKSFLYLGISRGRTESISTGMRFTSDRNAGVPDFCGVQVYRHDSADLATSQLLDQISLGDYGNEIYDILPYSE